MSNMTNKAAATKQEKKNRKERYVHGTQTQFDTRLMYKQGGEHLDSYVVGRLCLYYSGENRAAQENGDY